MYCGHISWVFSLYSNLRISQGQHRASKASTLMKCPEVEPLLGQGLQATQSCCKKSVLMQSMWIQSHPPEGDCHSYTWRREFWIREKMATFFFFEISQMLTLRKLLKLCPQRKQGGSWYQKDLQRKGIYGDKALGARVHLLPKYGDIKKAKCYWHHHCHVYQHGSTPSLHQLPERLFLSFKSLVTHV